MHCRSGLSLIALNRRVEVVRDGQIRVESERSLEGIICRGKVLVRDLSKFFDEALGPRELCPSGSVIRVSVQTLKIECARTLHAIDRAD